MSSQDRNVDFFQGLVVKKRSTSGGGDFSVSHETGKVHFCIHQHKLRHVSITLQHGQKVWSRVLAKPATSHLLKYLTLQAEMLMRTAAVAYGIYAV